MKADVTELSSEINNNFDAGVCTLGISIIPDYYEAYKNLLSKIKKGGEIIIGDLQLASGWYAFINPIIILTGKRYGATREGHKNSLELCKLMQKDLSDVLKKVFFMNTYFYCIGKKK